jgi:hypothetical protein
VSRRGGIPLTSSGLCLCATALLSLLLAPGVRADDAATVAASPAPAPLPGPSPQSLPPPPEPLSVDRPRLSLALGMGVSFDDTGFSPRRTAAVPSFFALGGFGDGFVGIDFGLFASTATGRFRTPDAPVDRLGMDAMLVLRPVAHGVAADERRWVLRALRTAALEAGAGYERDGHGASADQRFGFRLGGRLEFPLTATIDPSQLRLRLAARHLSAGTKATGAADNPVRDTVLELYAALAVVF